MPTPFMPKPSQKPASMFERLGITRPAAKPEVKPQAAPPAKAPGLFGQEGYKTQWQLREFARKAPYESMPGTAGKLSKEKRVGLVKELEERAKKAGQTFGVSERTFRERLLPQMKKEKYQLHIAGKYNEEKQLERKMQQYEKWIKGD